MNLYEYEGKELLSHHGIRIPERYAIVSFPFDESALVRIPCMMKAMLLQGRRGVRGFVTEVRTHDEANLFFRKCSLYEGTENVRSILCEEISEKGLDIYFSIAYHPQTRGARVTVRSNGGTHIEEENTVLCEIGVSPLIHAPAALPRTPALLHAVHQDALPGLERVLNSALQCFFINECTLIEINPLRYTSSEWIALDAKVVLDDRAQKRHPQWSQFGLNDARGRQMTEREQIVRRINDIPEYKGSPCSYIELDGDIALFLSGGGASLVVFDECIRKGLRPGNYSEYSGNPTKEKVSALLRVVLSKPNQKGLLIAGAIANFTMIDETMRGVAVVLAEHKPAFPIVIRRQGPNAESGKEIIETCAREHGLSVTWCGADTSLLDSVNIFLERINSYVRA